MAGRKKILYSFKSRTHHYVQSPPSDDENIEWLSLLREYGGPTRLLDLTTSFYIAAFFAIEDAKQDACVWAIDSIQPFEKARQIGFNPIPDKDIKGYGTQIRRYLESFVTDLGKKSSLVLPITPPKLNERQAIQKGIFLFPCDISQSFESNLCQTFDFPFNTLDSENADHINLTTQKIPQSFSSARKVVKINLPIKLYRKAIKDLHQMNIDAASLFPGLDGFAQSLKFYIRLMENTNTTLKGN